MLGGIGRFVFSSPRRLRVTLLGGMAFVLIGPAQVLTSAGLMQKEPVHARALSTSIEVTKSINAACESVRKETNASRCRIYEFHNGSESLAGVPFLKVSNTYEVTAPGVSSEMSRLQAIPISVIQRWLPDLVSGRCVRQPTESAEGALRQNMEAQGIRDSLTCPVFAPYRAEPVGYVSLNYTVDRQPGKDWNAIEKDLRALASQVIAQLQRARGT